MCESRSPCMSAELSHDELRALTLRQLEGNASEEEMRRLNAALRESVEARREYVALARQHAQLFELAEERKVVVLDQPRLEPKMKSRFRWPRLAWAAGFVLLAGLAAMLWANRTPVEMAPRIAFVEGEARLRRPAGERALAENEQWLTGEVLRTFGRS